VPDDEEHPDFNRDLLTRRPSMYGVPVGRDQSYRPSHLIAFASLVAVGGVLLIVLFG
jgi:hypothetical protein